ncbi:MAG: ADP-ribosylglycohydrolase family protein [Aggregatilineales bacterium]
MLVELAVGDAYGAGFEYATEMIEYFNNLSSYVNHPRHYGILPGMYTDDTQMTIAIAELIVSGDDWTPLNIATKFVECFKRDEREGYAGGFYRFLQEVQTGEEFLAKIRPDSDKSGAAMRAAPVGVFADIKEVLEKTRIQAAVTHNTPDGIAAAQAAALMAHYFLYDIGAKSDLGAWLENQLPDTHKWNTPYVGKVKSKGWMSVRAAITAVMRNSNLGSLLQDCINFRGDVDTVATIALAAAAHSREYRQNLPHHLIQTLENNTYGRAYLQKLDTQLMAIMTDEAS